MPSNQLSRKEHARTLSWKNQKTFRKKQLFFFVLPCLLYIFLFKFVPIWGWGYAFVHYKPGKSLFNSQFVGFDNITMLFKNPVIRRNVYQSLRNTLGMNFLDYVFMPLPMLFAVFLNEVKSKKFRKVVQTVSTLPHFISWVVVYSLISGLLSGSGVLNGFLVEHGIISEPINILATKEHVWLNMTIIEIWKGLGWSAVVYFSALSGIDQGMYEAAMIDGAGRFQRIWYITLPHLVPTFFVLLIMRIGHLLDTGVDKYLIFGNAINNEFMQTFDLYVYNLGLASGNIYGGVAVGVLKTVVGITLFSGANWLSKKVRGSGIA